jgi:CspA family cold shock protein
MALGTVKFFDDTHGYGFITPDGGGADIPAHTSDLGAPDLKTLTAGQRVSFDIVEGNEGRVPTNIQVV